MKTYAITYGKKEICRLKNEDDAVEMLMTLLDEWYLAEWNSLVNCIGNIRIHGKNYSLEKAIAEKWDFFRTTTCVVANDPYKIKEVKI